jgi:xanthosine phosphorylase
MIPLSENAAYVCAEIIQKRRPSFKPLISLVLGSGLGSFVDSLEDPVTIPYDTLPGFPSCQVKGHAGNVVLGYLNGVSIACLQGRAHCYEGYDNETLRTYVRTLHLLGSEYFLATNASGSMREDAKPGDLMLITDHINLQPMNPLTGPNDDRFGPRFFPLDNAYDLQMRENLLACAKEENIKLHQGVYVAVLGPHYETSAEIRAFRILGGDAVGMSTVPEVLVANHCGMKVAVIAAITNYATGLSQTSHSHDEVVAVASKAAVQLTQLLKRYISSFV